MIFNVLPQSAWGVCALDRAVLDVFAGTGALGLRPSRGAHRFYLLKETETPLPILRAI
jgi:16S rRNA G966 N2-methylase RsmD